MTRMDSSSAAEFEDQVTNVVESHVAVLQGVSCKLRLIAIPMTIRASEPLQEDDLLLKNVPAMRAVFRKLQLIRPNDGIVLLDTLFSHQRLIKSNFSEVYRMASALVNVVGGSVGTKADFSLPLAEDHSNTPNANGTYYLVGLVCWSDAEPPPVIGERSKRTLENLRTSIQGLIGFELSENASQQVVVNSGFPEAYYRGLIEGQKMTMDSALGSYLREHVSNGGLVEVHLTFGARSDLPRGITYEVDVYSVAAREVMSFCSSVCTTDVKVMKELLDKMTETVCKSGATIASRAFSDELPCGYRSVQLN